jgi:hypothetical protein
MCTGNEGRNKVLLPPEFEYFVVLNVKEVPPWDHSAMINTLSRRE